jgi:fructokinase
MILSCGDALIDFLPVKSIDGRDAMLPVVGGSCLNIAIGLARLGAPTGFVGGISTDLYGRMIADHATASRVDLRYTERSARPTTLAFVRAIDGEPSYAFYDDETASRHWQYRQGAIAFTDVEAIHVGSTTLVSANGTTQVLRMIDEARGSTTISFDPNCRPNLVHDQAGYVGRMNRLAARADIVRLSDADFAFLYGDSDHARKAEAFLDTGTILFVVTQGDRGARAWHRQAGAIAIEAPRLAVVDTIGAGDSFQAGLLFALRAMDLMKRASLTRANAGELARALAFATGCAAITCARAGADPPRIAEIGGALIEGLVR